MFRSAPPKPAETTDAANHPHVRVEEKLVDVEVVSYSGSSDVSETEEHVTVHAKREPLPWSMRETAYDKPLPGVASDRAPSPLPVISSMQQKSPLHTFFGPTTMTAEKDGGGRSSSSSSSGASQNGGSRTVGRRFRELTNIPVPETVALPLGAGTVSPALPLAPVIDISSPHSAEHQQSPAPSAGIEADKASPVQAPASPAGKSPVSPTAIERSPSPLQLSEAASSLGQRSPLPKQSSPSLGTASPQPLPMDFFDTSKPRAPSPGPVADIGTATLEAAAKEPLPPSIKERASSPSVVSLDILEAGLSPLARPQTKPTSDRGPSPVESLNLLELGLSPSQQPRIFSPTLGDKRAISPQRSDSKAAPSPMLKQARTISGHTQATPASMPPPGVDKRLYAHYRADWRVNRPFRSEQFFFPSLFNSERLQYLRLPRRRRPVPRRFSVLAEDAHDPGARYRRDWQSYRRYYVYDYFNPQLFEEGHLRRTHAPLKRKAKKRHFRGTFEAMGITDLDSPAAQLRLDTKTNRTHPVEHYFEPALFDANVTPYEALRADWYTVRPRHCTKYYNPMLVDLRYNQRKAHNFHFMIKRLSSGIPYPYPSRIKKPVTDPGQKYREDWQVRRAHHVYEFFDPELFNESRALQEVPYWHSIIAKFNGSEYGQKPKEEIPPEATPVARLAPEAVAIPVAPQSPTLLVSPKAAPMEGPSRTAVSPFAPMPDAAQLIANLRPELGEANNQGQSYDWPFWQWFFSKDGDRNLDDLLGHLYGEKFAPLPQPLLGCLWKILAGETTANQDRYNEILLGGNQDSIYADQLVADVDASGLPEAAQRQQLFRLVAAYLNYDPEFVYTPAIMAVAAPLVAVGLNDEDAFAALTHIMMTHRHRELLQEPEQEDSSAAYALEVLLTEVDPELAGHLQRHGVSTDLYAPTWYNTLFAKWIPPGLRQQYLSSYLVEGVAASHRLALTMLVENREDLLAVHSFGDIIDILLSGQLTDVHPDWNDTYRTWMVLMGQLSLSSEDLLQLAADYGLSQHEKHEQCLQSTLASVEREHALLGGYLAWVIEEVQRLYSDRERLYLELIEWHTCCESHKERIQGQRRYIHLLETDLMAMDKEHQEDTKKLTALLASEPLPMPMPSNVDRHHQQSRSPRQVRRQKTSKWEK